MKKKTQTEPTPRERRKALEQDVEEFLKAGNKIQYIANGVSAQDPQGKVRPLRISHPNKEPGNKAKDAGS